MISFIHNQNLLIWILWMLWIRSCFAVIRFNCDLSTAVETRKTDLDCAYVKAAGSGCYFNEHSEVFKTCQPICNGERLSGTPGYDECNSRCRGHLENFCQIVNSSVGTSVSASIQEAVTSNQMVTKSDVITGETRKSSTEKTLTTAKSVGIGIGAVFAAAVFITIVFLLYKYREKLCKRPSKFGSNKHRPTDQQQADGNDIEVQSHTGNPHNRRNGEGGSGGEETIELTQTTELTQVTNSETSNGTCIT